MDEIGLPRPAKTSNVFGSLERDKLFTRVKTGRGAVWKLTPNGRGHAEEIATDMDLAALLAEASQPGAALLGDTPHPVLPPSLAPPDLLGALHQFLDDYPFERNVWGCRYGIAFFEARTPRGLTYNLTIEVGSCLVLGRRLALLKDEQLDALPSDLVGHIYKEVDLGEPHSVGAVIDGWIRDDLRIGD